MIEDNCDALGSVYEIEGERRFTGTIGDIGTSSFYPPHHMTMGEGGAVYTNNPLLHKCVRSFRDWGRDCVCVSVRTMCAGIALTENMKSFQKDMIINMCTAILDII